MGNILEVFEKSQMNKKLPEIRVGDTVRVHHKIKEGDKFKIQTFEGVVISEKGELSRLRVVVRKIAVGGIGVEKTFFLYHPLVSKIEILKRAKVRRAKLYYLRKAKGKRARKLKERMPDLSEILSWEEEAGESEKEIEEKEIIEENVKKAEEKEEIKKEEKENI